MVIEIKDIFTVNAPATSARPYLHENQLGALSISSTFLTDKRTLMNWIKRTAEAIGILRQMSNDIITRIHFTEIDVPNTGGRPVNDAGKKRVEKADVFAKKHFLKQALRAMVVEGIALGDGYLWKGKMEDKELKEIFAKVLKTYNIEAKAKDSQFIDEDFVGIKRLQYVASATMNIELHKSGTKIQSYIQRTQTGFGMNTFPTRTRTETSGDSGSTMVPQRK